MVVSLLSVEKGLKRGKPLPRKDAAIVAITVFPTKFWVIIAKWLLRSLMFICSLWSIWDCMPHTRAIEDYPTVDIMMDFWIFVKSENFTKFLSRKCSSVRPAPAFLSPALLPHCPVLVVMFSLSCPACFFCSTFPVLGVLSWEILLIVLSWLSRAVLTWLQKNEELINKF